MPLNSQDSFWVHVAPFSKRSSCHKQMGTILEHKQIVRGWVWWHKDRYHWDSWSLLSSLLQRYHNCCSQQQINELKVAGGQKASQVDPQQRMKIAKLLSICLIILLLIAIKSNTSNQHWQLFLSLSSPFPNVTCPLPVPTGFSLLSNFLCISYTSI